MTEFSITPQRDAVNIQISIGEAIDRWSILQIKQHNIKDQEKVEIVKKELEQYSKLLSAFFTQDFQEILRKLSMYMADMINVNSSLWKIEDQLREYEKNKNFGSEFIEAARKVYVLNDDRAKIKRLINTLTHSEYVEVKEYVQY